MEQSNRIDDELRKSSNNLINEINIINLKILYCVLDCQDVSHSTISHVI